MSPDPETKMSPNDFLAQTDVEKKQAQQKPIRQLLGSLWWLVHMSRCDIMVAVHELSKYMDRPTMKLWKALQRIVRYLKGTIEFGLVFKRPSDLSITPPMKAFVDSDWASCLKTRKSRSGGFIMYFGMVISYFSEMQSATAQSTCESECYGIIKIAKVISWLRDILEQCDKSIPEAAITMVDNEASIVLCQDGHFSKRSRHYDIAVCVAKEMAEKGIIDIRFIRTNEQPADVFTKALNDRIFFMWISDIMGATNLQNHFSEVFKRIDQIKEDSDTDEMEEVRSQKYESILDVSKKKKLARQRAKRNHK